MYRIKEIQYGTVLYEETLRLRNKVMRIPLGLDIFTEDTTIEKDATILGAFHQLKLVGVGVLSSSNDQYSINYLCIDTECQKSGIGGLLLQALEQIAISHHAKRITLDARVSAEAFYTKHGYTSFGETFLMDCAPVMHIGMEKLLP